MKKLKKILSLKYAAARRVHRALHPWPVIAAAGAITAYLSEVVARQSFAPGIRLTGFLISVLIFATVISFFYALMNSLWKAFAIVFALAFALSFASFLKHIYRDEPLRYSDLLLTSKLSDFVEGSMLVVTAHVVAPFLIGLAVAALLLLRVKARKGVSGRLSIMSASMACLIFVLNFSGPYLNAADGAGTGFILNFLFKPPSVSLNAYAHQEREQNREQGQTQNARVYVARGTNARAVASGPSLTAYSPAEGDESAQPEQDETPEILPNVVVILSESFWDAYSMNNLVLSEDPIPNYRRIAETCVSGNMISSTFGGGTDSVEYAVLTGCADKFTDAPGSPYSTSFLKKPINSLATLFKEKGYDAYAVHNYTKTFYDRDKAMPLLGFDAFVAEEDMDGAEYKGPFLDDRELTRHIIQCFEKSKINGNPAFIFGISMENHQPYLNKFEENPIKVDDDEMPGDLKNALESYLHGLKDADAQLGAIIDYFGAADEPVVVMFFGDHQPAIGPRFELYRHTGNMASPDNRTLEEIHRILKTPFLIWSNYRDETRFIENADAIFLGNCLLNYIGMEKPYFYRYLDMMYGRFRYISRLDLMYIDAENALRKRSEMPDDMVEMLAVYAMLVAELTS